MRKTKDKIDIYNEDILKNLKENYPTKWEKLNYARKDKWLTKENYPTYNQLVRVAKMFNIPFGYLFLDKLPERKTSIPNFRTLGGETYEISEELYDTINQVKKQQEWIKDILIEWGHTELPFAGKFDINSDKTLIVDEIKKILGIKNNWAEEKTNWKEAFNFLIDKFEEAGIFVVVNGIVGNNTHRKLEIEEFRGFVLYDEIAPFVFVNNNDFLSAKIFTLIHELVHILIGKSASFDLRNLLSANDETEKFCDRCAAEFLVPEKEILYLKNIDYEALAKRFKVSQIVIARRLLDTGKITKDDFYDFYKKYLRFEKRDMRKTKGGNFYNTINYRYSRKFLELLRYAVNNKQILYRDFYYILSLKGKTADEILLRNTA
ncbi:MAG: ImmA/IrrE family metallo-endopeptidase [Leptonema sp. (in: bacteria)]